MPKPYQPPPIDWQSYPSLRTGTVAKLLDVSAHCVRRMIKDGRLTAYTLDRKGRDTYRVATASVLKVMTDNLVHE